MNQRQQKTDKGVFERNATVADTPAFTSSRNCYSAFKRISILRFASRAFFYPSFLLASSISALQTKAISVDYPASPQTFLSVQGPLPGTGSAFLGWG